MLHSQVTVNISPPHSVNKLASSQSPSTECSQNPGGRHQQRSGSPGPSRPTDTGKCCAVASTRRRQHLLATLQSSPPQVNRHPPVQELRPQCALFANTVESHRPEQCARRRPSTTCSGTPGQRLASINCRQLSSRSKVSFFRKKRLFASRILWRGVEKRYRRPGR